VGQAAPVPVHISATSQKPAEGRQVVALDLNSVVQIPLEQTARSQESVAMWVRQSLSVEHSGGKAKHL
jgi:hypothetical protein